MPETQIILVNNEQALVYPPRSNPLLQNEIELGMQIRDMQENGVEPPFTPFLTKKQKQQLKRDAYKTRSKGAPSNSSMIIFSLEYSRDFLQHNMLANHGDSLQGSSLRFLEMFSLRTAMVCRLFDFLGLRLKLITESTIFHIQSLSTFTI